MLTSTAGSLVIWATLLAFGGIAVVAARRGGEQGRDAFLTARGSQGGRALSLSFFASALGTWILFAPPEVGTFAGLLGILGYAVGQALALAVFAWAGPRMRAHMPEGSTILQFVRERFGRGFEVYVAFIVVLYMFVFLVAELTAIGGAVELLSGVDRVVPIVAVAVVTAAYTAYGGLRASIATDLWQGWVVIALVGAGIAAVTLSVSGPLDSLRAGGGMQVTRVGAETFVVLTIAIVAANLFHQGLWQRVWAARDDAALRRGAAGSAALILPVVALMGFAGAVAAGRGVETPSLAFFSLTDALPGSFVIVVLVLALALVASSVDTLQNGLTSIVAVDAMKGRWSISAARIATALATIPAAALALQGVGVLRLFLIADLLAATMVLPVFAGLSHRVTTRGALSSAAAGLAGIVVLGAVRTGSLAGGLELLTLPHGPSLGAFLAAPAASGIVLAAHIIQARKRGDHEDRGNVRYV